MLHAANKPVFGAFIFMMTLLCAPAFTRGDIIDLDAYSLPDLTGKLHINYKYNETTGEGLFKAGTFANANNPNIFAKSGTTSAPIYPKMTGNVEGGVAIDFKISVSKFLITVPLTDAGQIAGPGSLVVEGYVSFPTGGSTTIQTLLTADLTSFGFAAPTVATPQEPGTFTFLWTNVKGLLTDEYGFGPTIGSTIVAGSYASNLAFRDFANSFETTGSSQSSIDTHNVVPTPAAFPAGMLLMSAVLGTRRRRIQD